MMVQIHNNFKHEKLPQVITISPTEIRMTTPDQADPSTTSAISREKERIDSTLLATLDRQRVNGDSGRERVAKTYKPK
jgi:hypothetical protein